MIELHERLDHAAGEPPGPPPDPAVLSAAGRRRVRRRRLAGGTALGAAPAVAVTLALAWGPGVSPHQQQNNQGPATSTGERSSTDGSFQRVEVSRAEVERRCSQVIANAGADVPFRLDDSDTGPFFEGQEVGATQVDRSGARITTLRRGCTIPQSGLEDLAGGPVTALPDTRIPQEVLQACGRFAGWDLSGWEVLSAADSRSFATAVLRSTNGYVATCTLARDGLDIGGGSRVWFAPEDGAKDRAGRGDYETWPVCLRDDSTSPEVHHCYDVGWLPGPNEADAIRVSWPGGSTTIHVEDGFYSAAFDVEDVNWPYDTPGPLEFTVYAEDGSELNRYAMSDLPDKAWDES